MIAALLDTIESATDKLGYAVARYAKLIDRLPRIAWRQYCSTIRQLRAGILDYRYHKQYDSK